MADDEEFPSPYLVKPYMTIVPGRRPKMKMHIGIGQAKNALAMYGSKFGCVRGGDLYEWRGDGWVRLYSVPENTPDNQLPWRS